VVAAGHLSCVERRKPWTPVCTCSGPVLVPVPVRLDDEAAGNQKRRDEIATLKTTVKQKECEIAELSSYMECLKAELDLLKPRADKYAHDCECYRQQYVLHADVCSC